MYIVENVMIINLTFCETAERFGEKGLKVFFSKLFTDFISLFIHVPVHSLF